MLQSTSTKVEKDIKQLNDSTFLEGQDTFLTLVAKSLHIVMFLVVGAAALFPCFTKIKDLKGLLSIYLFVSACILDIQLSVLQVVESVLNMVSNIVGWCYWIRKEFVTLVFAGLWYQVTPIFNFIDHVETYLRNASDEQTRSQIESTPVVASRVTKEFQHIPSISPTSSSASSFVSTPASSPQSTPISTRVNPYIRIAGATAFEEDLSDSDNESVGNLIARKPSLMVATVARSRTPSSSSLLVRSASIKHLGPTPTIRRRVSTASRASLNPIKTLEATLGAASTSTTTKFQRVGRSVVGVPVPQLKIQNGEKKQGKVAKVAKKWVGKVKAMARVGKKGKGGDEAIVV